MRQFLKRILLLTVGHWFKIRGARIIYFHSVDSRHPYGTRPEVFRSMMKLIADGTKDVVTIGELGTRLYNKEVIDNCLVITFDDGYADNAEIALPILKEYGLRATFFVVAGLIKDTSYVPDDPQRRHRLYPALKIMSKSQIRALADSGMEIGSHSFSHRYMKRDGRKKVRQELRDSKKLLEDLIGKPVVSFAFPNGEVPLNAREILQEEGYRQAVTTQWDCVTPNSDPYLLPRQVIYHYDSLTDLKKKLMGQYDYLRLIHRLKVNT